MLEDLIGTRGAYILDEKLSILGKVPITELTSTVKSLNSGIYAIVLDGAIDKDLTNVADTANVVHLIAMDTKVKPAEAKTNIITVNEL